MMFRINTLVNILLTAFLMSSNGAVAELLVSKLDASPDMWLRADSGVAHVGGLVSSWDDYSGNGRNATQADSSFQPMFVEGEVNGHPVVRFSTDSLSFNGDFLVGVSYTVVAVEGRDRTGNANFFIAGSATTQNASLILGYERVDLLRQSHFMNDLNATVAAYTGTKEFALTTFTFDMSSGRSMHRFGELVAEDSSTSALTSYANPLIGAFIPFGYYYEGDVAEIILFNTALSDCDRVRVEEYLAAKYGLTLVVDPALQCDERRVFIISG